MNHWLIKSEPGTYSWDDLVKDKETVWDGIRNFQARNNLKAMKKGDQAFFYHSGDGKEIVGIATVTAEHFPDPRDSDWLAVKVSAKKPLKNAVTLAAIKADKRLRDMVLVKASRLSVQPVSPQEFQMILKLSESK